MSEAEAPGHGFVGSYRGNVTYSRYRIIKCNCCRAWVKITTKVIVVAGCELGAGAAAAAVPDFAEKQGSDRPSAIAPECPFECC